MTPVFTAKRRLLEVRVHVGGAPPLRSGKHKLDVYGVTLIYREDFGCTKWEFIHATFNGTWLDGHQRGKVGHRRYGRSSMDSIPDWIIPFIDDNLPKSENITHG